MRNIFFILFFIFIITGCSSGSILSGGPEASQERLDWHEQEVHLHADFKVYINDTQVDLSVPQYQLRHKSVHLEHGIGDYVHVHASDITMGYFFETMDLRFNKTCIIIPGDGQYCSTDNKMLSFYVNGTENDEFAKYEIKDSDNILITYGDIKRQLEEIN